MNDDATEVRPCAHLRLLQSLTYTRARFLQSLPRAVEAAAAALRHAASIDATSLATLNNHTDQFTSSLKVWPMCSNELAPHMHAETYRPTCRQHTRLCDQRSTRHPSLTHLATLLTRRDYNLNWLAFVQQ